jgi:hypothetical protein
MTVTRPAESDLAAALQAAEAGSSTAGGWPEQLPVEQQDAWMVMTEVEASLVGLARTRLAAGVVDHAKVRESVSRLGEPVLQHWPAVEVDRWRRVAELLTARSAG